jgi:4-amino-4-deoxy-L-arabinose transferase-like glycosyltransferase
MRYLGLILASLLVFIPGISSLPPTDRDESRYVQASRQMLETGDYVDIRFQDQTRYKKPAGIYWLHMAAAKVTGYGAKAPVWVFRTISVLGAVLTVVGILWLASMLFGPQAGMFSALAMTSAFGLAMEAHIAKTDAMLLATVVFSQAALGKIYVDAKQGKPAPFRLCVLFWIAQGLGILIKGPITPLLSGLTAGTLSIFDRDFKWLQGFRFGVGIVIMLAVTAPWFLLITLKSGGAFWEQSVGRDLLAKIDGPQESHGFPPGYYLLTYSLFVWPIAFLGLRAGIHALSRLRSDAALRFLVAWYLPFWIIFELIPTKLPHYMLPAYPALAIALGWYLANPGQGRKDLKTWQNWLLRIALFGLMLVTAAFAVGPAIFEWRLNGRISVFSGAIFVAAIVAGWLGSPAADTIAPLKRLIALVAAVATTYSLLTADVLPSLGKIWLSREIATVVDSNMPCADSRVAVTSYHEPSVVFLAGTQTLLTDPAGAARHLESDPACAIAAVANGDEKAFRENLGPLAEHLEKIASVDGINYSKGQSLEINIYKLGR